MKNGLHKKALNWNKQNHMSWKETGPNENRLFTTLNFGSLSN